MIEFNTNDLIVIIVVSIIGLLIYSLMKQFIYWLTFDSKFRATYKIITIIILVLFLKYF